MRPISIPDQGFRRIAQGLAIELDDQPDDYAAETTAPQSGANLQQVEQDLETLHQWIDYFMESKTMTEQEIQGLKDQVEFLESYVYDNTGTMEGQDTTELENRLNLLEQTLYEGVGEPEGGAPAAAAPTPAPQKKSPKKKKKKSPFPAAVPSDKDSKSWWQW
jgi:septation ring formation regulator EzrA